MSFFRDPSSLASQSSSFGGGGAGGNSFGVGVGAVIRGGDEGRVLSDILQAMNMDQSPLYVYQGFRGGGGSSDNGSLVGGGWMCPQRRGGWRRGQHQRVTSALLYQPRSAVGGRCGHMLFHNRLGWWRHTLSVAAYSIGGGGGGEKVSWFKL